MRKQRRYTSEEQILSAIVSAHILETQDIAAIEDHRKEIARLRPFPDAAHTVDYHKLQILLLEKRVRGREGRLLKMRAKLAEFRTLTFPGMADLVGDGSIAR